jgi:hypothetical protein
MVLRGEPSGNLPRGIPETARRDVAVKLRTSAAISFVSSAK